MTSERHAIYLFPLRKELISETGTLNSACCSTSSTSIHSPLDCTRVVLKLPTTALSKRLPRRENDNVTVVSWKISAASVKTSADVPASAYTLSALPARSAVQSGKLPDTLHGVPPMPTTYNSSQICSDTENRGPSPKTLPTSVALPRVPLQPLEAYAHIARMRTPELYAQPRPRSTSSTFTAPASPESSSIFSTPHSSPTSSVDSASPSLASKLADVSVKSEHGGLNARPVSLARQLTTTTMTTMASSNPDGDEMESVIAAQWVSSSTRSAREDAKPGGDQPSSRRSAVSSFTQTLQSPVYDYGPFSVERETAVLSHIEQLSYYINRVLKKLKVCQRARMDFINSWTPRFAKEQYVAVRVVPRCDFEDDLPIEITSEAVISLHRVLVLFRRVPADEAEAWLQTGKGNILHDWSNIVGPPSDWAYGRQSAAWPSSTTVLSMLEIGGIDVGKRRLLIDCN